MSMGVSAQAVMQQAGGRSQIISLPAPLLGLNTRDPVDGMDPTFALQMDNLFPESNYVRLRGGYETFCANPGTPGLLPGTIFNLVSGSTEYLAIVCDTAIYELQSGTPTARTGSLTITDDRVVWAVFADSSAPTTPKVLAVNGADNPWQYQGGTNAVAWSPTGTGLTASNLAWVFPFKNRVFAGEKDSRDFYYGALGAIPGTMTRFPLSGIRGAQGNILFMSAMTRDTGTGPDDYAVFVTTEGQVIVYAGTDPSDAAEWSLVGVYQIPRPIQSRKAHCQIFGDVVIATEQDYVFLSQALQQGGAFVLQPTAMSGLLKEAATLYGTNTEWQMLAWPEGNQIICNIPYATGTQYVQHVINAQTRAGCRYTGWDMATLGRYDGKLYGVKTDEVLRLDVGTADDASGTPTPIEVRFRSAWWDLKSPQIKHVQAIRPFFRTSQGVSPALALATDFRVQEHAANAQSGTIAETYWGDASGVTTLWGDTAATTTYWAGGLSGNLVQDRAWRLLSNRGTDFQLLLSCDMLNVRFNWISTDYKVSGAGGF